MQKNAVMLDDASLFCVYPKFIESVIFITKRLAVFKILQQLLIKPATRRVAGRSPAIGFILLFVAGLKANSCNQDSDRYIMRTTAFFRYIYVSTFRN